MFFAVIAAWFIALVSARLAGGLREFIAGMLRWSVRVQSYFFFLTDDLSLPTAWLRRMRIPSELAIPPPDELNRAAVLFRLFIAIPGSIVVNVLGAGLGIVSIGSWVVLLVTGELPRTVVRGDTSGLALPGAFLLLFLHADFGVSLGCHGRRSIAGCRALIPTTRGPSS